MEIRVDADGNPTLDDFSAEDFVDLVFRIRDLVEGDGLYRFHIAASYEGLPLGLNVEIVKDIGPGFDENMDLIREHVYRSGVRFLRSGLESDRLLATMDKLYALDLRPTRMVEIESFTAIALHQGRTDMESGPIKLKIFGKDRPEDSEGDYYESFLNVDLPNGWVFWNEKDQDYRAPLVKSLGGLD